MCSTIHTIVELSRRPLLMWTWKLDSLYYQTGSCRDVLPRMLACGMVVKGNCLKTCSPQPLSGIIKTSSISAALGSNQIQSISNQHLPTFNPACTSSTPMFGRVNQLIRHLSRPLQNYGPTSVAVGSSPVPWKRYLVTSSMNALENSKRIIRTAACLIIGDEVLGGKVCNFRPSQPFFSAYNCCRLGSSNRTFSAAHFAVHSITCH